MSGSEKLNTGPVIDVVALAMFDKISGQVMLARRCSKISGAGFWEFPGGKIEKQELPEQAIIREIQEELGIDLTGHELQLLGENYHQYDARRIRIILFRVDVSGKPEFKLVDHDIADWFDADTIQKINLSSGDKPFISLLF